MVLPDGSAVYIPNEGDDTVSVIDTATNTVTATIPVGRRSGARWCLPDGSAVYVAELRRWHGVGDRHSDQHGDGHHPRRRWLRVPGGAAGWVSGLRPRRSSDTVSVIDTATNTVTATIPVGEGPQFFGVALPDGSAVYIPHPDSRTVSVIDTATNTVTATVQVGEGPCIPRAAGRVGGLHPQQRGPDDLGDRPGMTPIPSLSTEAPTERASSAVRSVAG